MPKPASWNALSPAPCFELGGHRYTVHSYFVADPATFEGLTRAEREIAHLLMQGMSNAQIAATRRVSVHTVGNQIARMLRRMNVDSRYELIARLRGAD
jgi:DNA-binding CsgD family transcriptional regulator